MEYNKNGWSIAHSTSWATPSAYDKHKGGEPGQTVGRSSVHYEGDRPDALQGSRWGMGEYFYVPGGCIRFATSNTGPMLGKSTEVVETFHS